MASMMQRVLQMCGFTLCANPFVVYQNALAAAPQAIRYVLHMTDHLFTNGLIHEATTYVAENIVLIDGDDTCMFMLWWQSAMCKMAAFRFREAVTEFETALTKMVGPMEFFHMYGVALFNTGRFDDALAKLDKAIELAEAAPMPTLPCVRVMAASPNLSRMVRGAFNNVIVTCQNDPVIAETTKKFVESVDVSGTAW